MKNEWRTPKELFDLLDNQFHFTLDPASTHDNALCKKHFTKEEDGLLQDWSNDVVWLNPPYGREIGAWIEKAYNEMIKGAKVVCLIPSRTSPVWFHVNVKKAKEIWFIKGRIQFTHPNIEETNSPDFDSLIVIFDKFRGQQPVIRFWDWKAR